MYNSCRIFIPVNNSYNIVMVKFHCGANGLDVTNHTAAMLCMRGSYGTSLPVPLLSISDLCRFWLSSNVESTSCR